MLLVRRLVPITLAAALLGALVVGAAATLTVQSSSLGAGDAVVADCDDGVVSVTYVGAPAEVTAVQVTGLDGACNGGTAHATVEGGTGGSSAAGPAVVSAGGVLLQLSPSRPAESATSWQLVVVSP